MNEPIKYYMALAAGMLFVVMQHKEKPWLSRVSIAGISGAIGYSVAADLAAYLGRSETVAVVLVTAFSYAVLDTVGAILADRAAIKDIVRAHLGGGRK
jgi:hypothetical protein